MSKTKKLGLEITDDSSARFSDWWKVINGPVNSNMHIIDNAFADWEDKNYGRLIYKGSVTFHTQLPTIGVKYGDVRHVNETNTNYIWTGSSWDILGSEMLPSDFYTKKEIDYKNQFYIGTGRIGQPNGVAPLDDNGKVPASKLPSYVDDVLEFSSKTVFPTTGESGKIYVALDTNMSYRWGGTEYVGISSSLALGETSSTAYAGDKGKANADAIVAIQLAIENINSTIENINSMIVTANSILDTLNGEVI